LYFKMLHATWISLPVFPFSTLSMEFSSIRSKRKDAWLPLPLRSSERIVFLAALVVQQREAEEGNRHLLGKTGGAWTGSPKPEPLAGIEAVRCHNHEFPLCCLVSELEFSSGMPRSAA
jgi:hypothetical protein